MPESSGWDTLFLHNYLRYWVCNPWTQQNAFEAKGFWSLTNSCLLLAASLPCSNSLLIDISFYYSPMHEIANFHILLWCWLCHTVNNGVLCSSIRKTPPQPPQKVPKTKTTKPKGSGERETMSRRKRKHLFWQMEKVCVENCKDAFH